MAGWAAAAQIASQLGSDFLHNEWARDRQEDSQRAASEENIRARNWNEYMAGTAYQRQVQDLNAAGLNPMMAYMRSSAGAATPPSPSGSGGMGSPGSSNMDFAGAYAKLKQSELVDAQADLIKAQADNVRADTLGKQVVPDKLRQDIKESQERIQTYLASATQQYASAAHSMQQIENLKETIGTIRATTQQLYSLINLQGYQVQLVARQIGKTEEETREIIQKVKANLPEVERILKNLETYSATNRAKVDNTPVIGELKALLQAFNPLAGLLAR